MTGGKGFKMPIFRLRRHQPRRATSPRSSLLLGCWRLPDGADWEGTGFWAGYADFPSPSQAASPKVNGLVFWCQTGSAAAE